MPNYRGLCASAKSSPATLPSPPPAQLQRAIIPPWPLDRTHTHAAHRHARHSAATAAAAPSRMSRRNISAASYLYRAAHEGKHSPARLEASDTFEETRSSRPPIGAYLGAIAARRADLGACPSCGLWITGASLRPHDIGCDPCGLLHVSRSDQQCDRSADLAEVMRGTQRARRGRPAGLVGFVGDFLGGVCADEHRLSPLRKVTEHREGLCWE